MTSKIAKRKVDAVKYTTIFYMLMVLLGLHPVFDI